MSPILRKPVFWFAVGTGFAAGEVWGWRVGVFAWAACSFAVGLVLEANE